MREELRNGHVGAGIVGMPNGDGKKRVDRLIECELPAFVQLHDGNCCDKFCYGRCSDHRLRSHRNSCLEILEAESPRPHHRVSRNNTRGQSGDVIPFHLEVNVVTERPQSIVFLAVQNRGTTLY